MADQRTPRPVSGEIMTGAMPEGAALRRARPLADFVEAEYEVVTPEAAPASCREASALEAPAVAGPQIGGMDMLRKVAAGSARRSRTRGGPLFWSAGIGLALVAFWASGGHVLLRASPLAGGTSTPRASFSVASLSSRFDVSGPKPVLLVDGEAVNDGLEPGELPPLEIRVAAPDGNVTRYTLGTSGRTLGPGQRFAFSSRLDVPKNGVGTVSVTFTR
jgi:hypothetical protein